MSFWADLAADAPPSCLFSGCGPADVARRVGRGGIVYLATPYSREALLDGAWCHARSLRQKRLADAEAEALLLAGVTAIAPVSLAVGMVHLRVNDTWPAGQAALDPLDTELWEGWCRPLLARLGDVVVPDLPGWRESAGIRHEATQALHAGGRVFLYGEVG